MDNPSERTNTPNINIGSVDSEESRGIISGTSAVQISISSVGNPNAIEQIAYTPTVLSPLASVSNVFSPASLRILPRAQPRKKYPTDVKSNLWSLLTLIRRIKLLL